MSVGWVCPKCGSVWAPWVSSCTNCGGISRPVVPPVPVPHPSSPGTTTSIPDNVMAGADA